MRSLSMGSFPGRYWWREILFGVVAFAAAIIAPIMILSAMLPLDDALNQSHTPSFSLAGLLVFAFLLSAVIMLVQGARDCRRYRRRKAALHGQEDAIPLARYPVNTEKAPDVAAQPLALEWSATRTMRILQTPLILLLMIPELLVVLVAPIVFAVVTVVDASKNHTPLQTNDLLLLSASILVVLLAIFLFIIAVRYIPLLFGRPFGVTATANGIEARTELGRRYTIPWNEIRLFEVEGTGSHSLARRTFRIYSQRQVTSWRHNPVSTNDFAPHKMTGEEMTYRLQAMVDLIVARTSLPPRTFSRQLRLKEAAPAQPAQSSETQLLQSDTKGTRPRSAGKAVRAYLTLALMTLAVAVGEILHPLTSITRLNLLCVATFIPLLVVLVVASIQSFSRREYQIPETSISTETTSLPSALRYTEAGDYMLSYNVSLRRRLILFFMFTPLCLNLVPFVQSWWPTISNAFAPLSGVTSGPLNDAMNDPIGMFLSILLFLYGFFGLMGPLATIRARGLTIRATTEGISMPLGRIAVTFPWETIQSIKVRLRNGQVYSYAVAGNDGRTSITWLASTTNVKMTTGRNAHAIMLTPEEMAALVVERSGKPLQLVSLTPPPATR